MRDSVHDLQADARDRLAEIAEILAAGVVRVVARKSSRESAGTGESSLHLTADQSGHPPPTAGSPTSCAKDDSQ